MLKQAYLAWGILVCTMYLGASAMHEKIPRPAMGGGGAGNAVAPRSTGGWYLGGGRSGSGYSGGGGWSGGK